MTTITRATHRDDLAATLTHWILTAPQRYTHIAALIAYYDATYGAHAAQNNADEETATRDTNAALGGVGEA